MFYNNFKSIFINYNCKKPNWLFYRKVHYPVTAVQV